MVADRRSQGLSNGLRGTVSLFGIKTPTIDSRFVDDELRDVIHESFWHNCPTMTSPPSSKGSFGSRCRLERFSVIEVQKSAPTRSRASSRTDF